MPRISFSLRPTDGGVLRGHENEVGDDNDGLRASGLQIAPSNALEEVDTYFQAVSTCYGEVDLEWAVPIFEAIATPVVTQSIVVFGQSGPPETISAGMTVAAGPSTPGGNLPEGTTFFSTTLGGLQPGEFAYFSLFVLYQSTTGDEYYEKVAQISEMVPFNYQSTLDIWNRIPDFYQNADSSQGAPVTDEEARCFGFDTGDEPVGPLLRFFTIFGFEMDRQRSILTHIARAHNPSYSDVESLDAIAYEMGTVVNEADLGTPRLRRLLNDIGTFRRTKGTQGGTEFFIRSLSGSESTIDPVTRTIEVQSTRVNHITDPLNTGNLVENTRPAGDDEAQTPDQFTFGSVPPTSGGGTVYQLISPLTVYDQDQVVFSVHSGVGNVKWARAVDSTTGDILSSCGVDPFPLAPDPDKNHPMYYDTQLYFTIPMEVDATINIEFMVDTAPFGNHHYLLEKNSIGAYFDGSVSRGGWLIGSGASISDYRWAGTENDSVSLYSEDYEKTKQILNDVFDDVIPVDVEATYTISYNNIA